MEESLRDYQPYGLGGRGGAALRVVIAEGLALLRDGLMRLLRGNGFEVGAAVDDGRRGAAVLQCGTGPWRELAVQMPADPRRADEAQERDSPIRREPFGQRVVRSD